jgi:hypothetical protein
MIIDVLSLYINLIEKLIDIVEGKKRREIKKRKDK